jgi:hypothetical protein
MVERETLANPALGTFNFSVNLIGREIHETCGEVSEQHFKLEPLVTVNL